MAHKAENKVTLKKTTTGTSLIYLLMAKYKEIKKNYDYDLMSSLIGDALSKASDWDGRTKKRKALTDSTNTQEQ